VRPPPTEEPRLQALLDTLAWKAWRPEDAPEPEVGPHEYVVWGQTITEKDWLVVTDAIERHGGGRERYTPRSTCTAACSSASTATGPLGSTATTSV